MSRVSLDTAFKSSDLHPPGVDAKPTLKLPPTHIHADYASFPSGLPAQSTTSPAPAGPSTVRLDALQNPPSPYASLISQSYAVVPSFTLESGITIENVPVAYKTWGRLNERADNCMVICHALTGSADVEDWWGPLMGRNKAFDASRYFIFCANVIGSPYGTISPVTSSPAGSVWGPDLPGSCVKDDVRLHYLVLEALGVRSVAVVIGGSMGGMTTLEYALNTPPGFVRHIVPIATSARHSAWGISWGEAQRQSIYSDPEYQDGYYYNNQGKAGESSATGPSPPAAAEKSLDDTPSAPKLGDMASRQPVRGLAAARMAALLTYRSRDSFESRFGRRAGRSNASAASSRGSQTPAALPDSPSSSIGGTSDAWRAHNDGHRAGGSTSALASPALPTPPLTDLGLSMPGGSKARAAAVDAAAAATTAAVLEGATDKIGAGVPIAPPKRTGPFSAQSYLRYQGDKFTARFDANCYIHITRKMDTHDISYPSSIRSQPPTLSEQLPDLPPHPTDAEETAALEAALSLLPPALVIGIESDGLFTTREQREIARSIPDSQLVIIPSPDGHDGFLLEFEALNKWVLKWLMQRLPEVYAAEPMGAVDEESDFKAKKESLFGEAEGDEADVTRW